MCCYVSLCVYEICFALEVIEEEDEVAVRDDGELVLNCTGDEPWDYCR